MIIVNINVEKKKKLTFMFTVTIKFRLHAEQPAGKKYYFFFFGKPNADLEVLDSRQQLR